MKNFQRDFIEYAIACEILQFGDFTLKSGRKSPYFFNTGGFNDGQKLGRLGEFYAQAIVESGINFNLLYGPAYKGIPLVCATSIALSKFHDVKAPFAFNRKEGKSHGEGGVLVGASLEGSILILDDVITAGTSIRESVEIIQNNGGNPTAVVIALDRQEKGQNGPSAIAEIEDKLQLPVMSIITLACIVEFLGAEKIDPDVLRDIKEYRNTYGV